MWREWQSTPVFLPGESHGQKSQQATVCGVAKSRTCLSYIWGFSGASGSKESACSVGGPCSVPGMGRSPREGNSSPLQSS